MSEDPSSGIWLSPVPAFEVGTTSEPVVLGKDMRPTDIHINTPIQRPWLAWLGCWLINHSGAASPFRYEHDKGGEKFTLRMRTPRR